MDQRQQCYPTISPASSSANMIRSSATPFSSYGWCDQIGSSCRTIGPSVFYLLTLLFRMNLGARGVPSLSTLPSPVNIASCDSPIYCSGPILHTVQMARLFPDSKTFVDMHMRYSVQTVQANFYKMMNSTASSPSHAQIASFVENNFETVNEFDDWTPGDYTENPAFLHRINHHQIRQFGRKLHHLWLVLARKIKPDIQTMPERYSLLYAQNGFIIPGGRFKEFYYWDTYWIIKGLLVSGMCNTVAGMIDNFMEMVHRYGFIPNGARVYYLNRSQPPLLVMMADAYLTKCNVNRTAWLHKHVDTLQQEMHFWLRYRQVTVKNGYADEDKQADPSTTTAVKGEYWLARYAVNSNSPRPESYFEDVETANQTKAKYIYSELKSGAESGWDFSSRWIMDDSGGNKGSISQLNTSHVIPVDLNAILCHSFHLLSKYNREMGRTKSSKQWNDYYQHWRLAVHDLMYDHTDGIWYDLDARTGQRRRYFYPSNFAPLWAPCYWADGDGKNVRALGTKAATYYRNNGIQEFMGGIPSSLVQTGEQWDFPNAWPPSQSMVIVGLARTGSPSAQKTARQLANEWLQSNMLGFNRTGHMFEKYDAVTPGMNGGGGEYIVQSGFGWTNGVCLELIDKYYS